jgi:hypothetical protein
MAVLIGKPSPGLRTTALLIAQERVDPACTIPDEAKDMTAQIGHESAIPVVQPDDDVTTWFQHRQQSFISQERGGSVV